MSTPRDHFIINDPVNTAYCRYAVWVHRMVPGSVVPTRPTLFFVDRLEYLKTADGTPYAIEGVRDLGVGEPSHVVEFSVPAGTAYMMVRADRLNTCTLVEALQNYEQERLDVAKLDREATARLVASGGCGNTECTDHHPQHDDSSRRDGRGNYL